jgi:toxin-antitoxin system PIN domain toxin
MISFDTNIAVYAANSSVKEHIPAVDFLENLTRRQDVVVCELMLVELYLKLRNSSIFPKPKSSLEAVAFCQSFRECSEWQLVESASVMEEVWRLARRKDFGFRRLIDARLALTLRHHGVTEFATGNVRDFEGFGFSRVWNPVQY